LIVYLRFSVDKISEPVSVFLDIIELESATANAVLEALLGCLDEAFLQNHWLGLGTDGAAVMTGTKAGLIAKIKESYPNVIGWHCFNHKLELAVGDAVKACTQINHYKIFMDKLYSLYTYVFRVELHHYGDFRYAFPVKTRPSGSKSVDKQRRYEPNCRK